MEIELGEEVAQWIFALTTPEFIVVDRHIELLREFAHLLRMPHSRHLGEGLLELRFTITRSQWRITYWFAPNEIIVLLTVFRKQKNNEQGEIARARQVLKVCQEDHL
jgi:phage-related protein